MLASARTRKLFAIGCAVLLTAGLTACNVTPDQDSFYQSPAPVPAHPGDIVRSRPATFTLDPVAQTAVPGVKSWQVLYRSTDAAGQPDIVSGTVLVPTTPWLGLGPRPLISYGVGTRGIGDACAPSYTLANGTDYEGAFINGLLSRGWAVAVTDYQGLGTPGGHTYMVGRSQGMAVLDMARAAMRLDDAGISANAPVGIMGYSQGGASAGWAGELQPTYAPELKLKGIAAGGVPADLTAVAEGLDGGPFVALALLAAFGYNTAYPSLNLQSYLNPAGQQLFADAQNVCLVSVDGIKNILGTANHHLTDYTTTDPLQTPAWQARLNENKLGSGKPTVPVFQYHALTDEMVAFGQADQLHKDWCAKGVNLTWSVLPIAEHATGMVEGIGPATDFMAARFLGLPAFSNC